MSEYWVSQGKFYCKYCKVYIADDKPSRSHHDSGFRHKGNLERYIREIYKKGNKQEREKAEEARQIAAIDAAAAAAMGISAEQASTSGSAPPKFRKKAASSGSGPSYTTAADLGFTDPEAERMQREKELREKEGVIGEWSFVTPVAGPSRTRSASADQHENGDADLTEEPPKTEREEPDNRKVSHAYLKEKSLPVLDDDDYDSIKIKVRTPKETPAVKDALAKAREQARTQAPASEEARKHQIANGQMKFKAVDLKEYEESPEEQEERYKAALELIEPKSEADEGGLAGSTSGVNAAAPLFKKRKAKAGDPSSSAKRRG
ncbi:hypothetical protein P389DRAFT_178799 [Cystobasidium minutum MCA 4210]|uniref:uncharacterized protein n=1 Tax=Cystobasidium minutum MCA 4210 TaxID=1397322 RepID=UPI0034CF84A3|eukprot:jgi/Rhomi1/178799/fgenesh1_pg.3_\